MQSKYPKWFPQEKEFKDLPAIREYPQKTIQAYTMTIHFVNSTRFVILPDNI